jgi:O-antigen/teichoic acid export membrane protein
LAGRLSPATSVGKCVASFRRNVIANLAGRVWASALGLVFPPIYARILGIESYGLVGVWASLTAILSVVDLGLSTTLNREIARYSTESDEAPHREMRVLARTIEVVFWAAGGLAGGLIILLAPLISHHWMNAQRLPTDVVTSSIRLMGVVFALQWPVGVYNGALLGLQKQVTANVIQSVFLVIRQVGGAVLLWKVIPTIHAFFVWQAVIMAAQTVATGAVLGRNLPGSPRDGVFRWGVLAKNWRFSTGMLLISILAIILMQTDKIVVSKLLTLEQFGYYTLAWVVAGALANLVNPIFVAVFPRLTQLVKQGDLGEVSRVYHTACQVMAVIVFPAAAVLGLFSREIVLAWTGDPRTVTMVSGAVAVMAIGSALNGLMNVPYALQLAYGWTRLTIVTNLVAVIVMVPLEYWLAKHHGMLGAASGWMILNAGYVLIQLQVMHIRLLPGEQWRWYLSDVGLPLLGVAAVLLPARIFLHAPQGRLAICAYLGAVAAVAVVSAAIMVPDLRVRGLKILMQFKSQRSTSRGDGPRGET